MHLVPKTQKAQGIMALVHSNDVFELGGPGRPIMVIPGSLDDCAIADIKFPVFARPCPYEPRHGFVDSHLVYNWFDVVKILQKATAAEFGKPAEVVLAPPLSGVVSAVATNAGVTWGYGNDGITAGSDSHPLFIPVKVTAPIWRIALKPLLHVDTTFDMPECPYLEIVENNGKMCVVQTRSGPEQLAGINYVVRKIKVRYVLHANRTVNLLAWEKLVTSHKNAVGTVIYAPNMSLSAHCCVHGIENGIPIITDYLPKVNDVIAATKNKVPALTKREYRKLAALITTNLASPIALKGLSEQKRAFLTAIATIQAQFCWGKQKHLLHLRSLAVVLLLKGVVAGCCGEIRHWTHERMDTKDQTPPELAKQLPEEMLNGRPAPRTIIYAEILNQPRSLSSLMAMLKAAKTDFLDVQWCKSFGGRPWTNVAMVGIALNVALEKFLNNPCSKTWSCVIQRANRLINTSHNTGKCLTKWVSSDIMDAISLSPTVGFLNPYTAFVALGMNREQREGKNK